MNPADGCETHVASDAFNCGACNTTCATNQVCTSGACACRSGFTNCPMSGGCVNTNSDPRNCGSCGQQCGGASNHCSMGSCTTTCATGLTSCPTSTLVACVDVNNDPSNCGSCGNVCNGNQTCQSGMCVAAS